MKQKQNEKEAKIQSKKRMKWNSGKICKETKKNIKVGLLVCKSIPSKVKRWEKTFILFCFKAKQSEKTYISLRFKAKQKNRKWNKAKQKIFGSETKRKYAVLILLWSEVKNSKRKKGGTILFFHVSVQKACETDLVSLHFALKRKIFFAKLAHPSIHYPAETFEKAIHYPLANSIGRWIATCNKPNLHGVFH
jgi:hypothetical protein